MEFLIRVFCCFLLPFSCFMMCACSKNFSSVIEKPPVLEFEKNIGQSFIDGSFLLESGQLQGLPDLNDKPMLIYFVGEDCLACFQETVELKKLIAQKGLPTKVHLISVMIGVSTQIITNWFDEIDPQVPEPWILGSDLNLKLYHRYFDVLSTPSVMYFNPHSQVLYRWQKKKTIEEIQQETGSWY